MPAAWAEHRALRAHRRCEAPWPGGRSRATRPTCAAPCARGQGAAVMAEHIDIPHPTREGHCGGGVYSCCRKLKAAMSKMGVWVGICYGNIVSISSFFPLWRAALHTKLYIGFKIKKDKISFSNWMFSKKRQNLADGCSKKTKSSISTPRRARAHRAGPRPAQRQGQRHAEIADAPWACLAGLRSVCGVARPAARPPCGRSAIPRRRTEAMPMNVRALTSWLELVAELTV